MTIRKAYIGSLGPFYYDDAEAINDPDGDFAGENQRGLTTDGEASFNGGGAGGASGTVTVVTALRWNALVLEHKTRDLTISGGVVTAIGTESGWTTVP